MDEPCRGAKSGAETARLCPLLYKAELDGSGRRKEFGVGSFLSCELKGDISRSYETAREMKVGEGLICLG